MVYRYKHFLLGDLIKFFKGLIHHASFWQWRFTSKENSFYVLSLAVELVQPNNFRKTIAFPSEIREQSLHAANVKLRPK